MKIIERLEKLIAGQFMKDILCYEIYKDRKSLQFRYYVDYKAFNKLKDSWLGRSIIGLTKK